MKQPKIEHNTDLFGTEYFSIECGADDLISHIKDSDYREHIAISGFPFLLSEMSKGSFLRFIKYCNSINQNHRYLVTMFPNSNRLYLKV